jgi:hypothetical protein
MGLLSNLVSLADNLTRSFDLQASIVHHPYSYSDGAGRRLYATAVARRALYTRNIKRVTTFAGEEAVSTAQVVFLDPTVINEFDKIVLPDGTTQPIIGTSAFVDASNGPVLTEIFLGWVTQ